MTARHGAYCDIGAMMLSEMNKPETERNVFPMILFCKVCKIVDCGVPKCPLSQAKFKNRYIPYADFAASQGAEDMLKATGPPADKEGQYALF